MTVISGGEGDDGGVTGDKAEKSIAVQDYLSTFATVTPLDTTLVKCKVLTYLRFAETYITNIYSGDCVKF